MFAVLLSEPPPDIPALFTTERSLLLRLLRSLDESDWQMPSPCPEWSILGLCVHLLGDDFSSLSRHRDQHHGTPSPEGLTETQFIDWLDGLQVEWVRAARRLSPALVVDLLAWTGPQLTEVFAHQDPRQRCAQVSWAGPDPVPVWLDQIRELSEYWIHRQQILQALRRPSDLQPAVLGPILEGLRWAYPFRLAQVRAEPGDTVSIDISGPVAAEWFLVATATGWDFRSQPGAHLVARASMTSEEAWRLLSNNLPVGDHARLRLSGDEQIVDVIRRTRAIIGSPR